MLCYMTTNYLNIEEKSFQNSINKIKNSKEKILRMINEDISGFTRIGQLKDIILERYKRLE